MHIVPLLMADMSVLDDYARQYLARNDWVQDGRPLAALLNAVLSFGPAAVNLYPLPLLLAVLITAHALANLVQHWFTLPTVSAVLVVLPLWMQPFFLQNLSYQYDGASMALSLACSLWAITLGCQWAKPWLGGTLLVAASAALYQPGLNVFAGLCCLEIMRVVMNGSRFAMVCKVAAVRLGQLLVGVGLFYVSCAWMVRSERTALLAFDGLWLTEMSQRLAATVEVVSVLVTPWVFWGAVGLCLLAAFSLGRKLQALWRRPYALSERLGLVAALLLPVALILLCIPGLILFLEHFDPTARVLMGLGAALTMLLYVVHDALAALPRVRLVVLATSIVFMLSMSFAYGRVLMLQKALHQAVAQSVAHDLSSQPELAAARHYYLLGYWQSRLWVPAAKGTLAHMPAIEVIDANRYVMLPEMLPRVGIDDPRTFYQSPPLTRRQVLARSPSPRVVSRFYDIHLVGDAAYVLIKLPQATGQEH
ncbi:glucosyltransferase domain-containing protein [Pseudomonas putida]|uniref:glucosyltransferase domain-containing protein n=1 Tax=Pseudomonas putida TaxID=303 RepID=UPI00226F417B|nr:glucosyltransferase domain-containing protein [Pseudomonas putida]WAB98905.1 glucosyltransferase domain-containing protein [Pseudomonas putida]